MKLIINEEIGYRLPVGKLTRLLLRTLKKYKQKKTKEKLKELSLVLVSRARIKGLNKKYLGQDKVTDVLSFGYGEIIICLPVAKKQAREHRLSINDEICLLFVHGLLHILGFDHKIKKDKIYMQKAEIAILGRSGLISESLK